MHRWVVCCLAGALGAGVIGCAGAQKLRTAESAFQKAQDGGAETAAPYEYYAAEAYLNLAQHEEFEMDYKAVNEFAGESLRYSEAALEKAGGGDR